MVEYLAVSLGGAIGALLRFIISQGVKHSTLPQGTMWVNLGGAFLIGLVMACVVGHDVPPWVKAFIVTGGLGGLTTFSTFSYEALQLLQQGAYTQAAIYVGVQLLGGLVLCGIGYELGKTMG